MCATLNAYINSSDKIKYYLSVCSKQGVSILPPDVNVSETNFALDGKDIRFGLRGLKNLGKSSLAILAERGIRGIFKTLQEFAERMAKYSKIDKSVIESLIYTGAFDSFEGSRRAKLLKLTDILNVASVEKNAYLKGQLSIFDLGEELGINEIVDAKFVKIGNEDEFSKKIKLEMEKEYAGFYLTEHPLDEYADRFKNENILDTAQLKADEDDEEAINQLQVLDGKRIKVAGIVTDIKVYYTKRNNKPLNVFTLEDKTGEVKCVAFSDVKAQNEDKIVEGKLVIINGEFSMNDRGNQIIVKAIAELEKVNSKAKQVVISANQNIEIARKQWLQVGKLIKDNNGKDVEVFFLVSGKYHKMNDKAVFNQSFLSSLYSLVGEGNVEVRW